jgi:hypothetical protein
MTSLFGIIDSRDLAQSAQTIGEGRLYEAQTQVLAEYSSMWAEWFGAIAMFTTEYQERYGVVGGGELQPSDEYGRPLATRPAGYFDVAYPLYQFGDRKGWTDIYLAKVTGDRISRELDDALLKDRTTMLKMLLRCVLTKENATFTDPDKGSLTIRRLANNDGGLTPPEHNGNTFASTHTHYYGTNNATLATTHLQGIYDHLHEHGLSGHVVLEVADQEVPLITALTGFVEAESRRGGVSDPVTPTFAGGNERTIGWIKQMEVRNMGWMPDGYMFAYDERADPPVAVRQDAEAELQGFRLVSTEDRYPLRNAFFRRRAGMGVRNRLNGVAVQIVASTSYTTPTI